MIWRFKFSKIIPTIDPWLNTRLVYYLYLKSLEGPWLVDRLWEAHLAFFLLHNRLLQVAIWLGPWTVSLLGVLTTWQTLVYWSVIYLCEWLLLVFGLLGVPCVPEHGIRAFMKNRFRFFVKIWNRCCQNFERVYGSIFICICGLWEIFHCIWSTVSIGK